MIRVAKTKALISFAVTSKLICVFVFTYAKSRFPHDAAQMLMEISITNLTHCMLGNFVCFFVVC